MGIRVALLFALVWFCAATSSAHASAILIGIDGSYPATLGHWDDAHIGDKFTLRLYLDADQTGIQLLSVGVLYDPYSFKYNPKPNADVGVPSYILYGMSGMMSTWLAAQQSTWLEWPGTKPPGWGQINVNWADASFVGTHVTGIGKIAELEFEIISTRYGGDVRVTMTAGGNIFQANGNPNTPITLRGVLEPTTALLVGLGLAGLAPHTSSRRHREW